MHNRSGWAFSMRRIWSTLLAMVDKKKIAFCFVWALLLYPPPLFPEDLSLPAWDDPFAVHVLASSWLLLEKEGDHTRIRIYRRHVNELKCVVRLQCHYEQLMIAIETFGDHPTKRVYQLPPALYWNSPEIVHFTDATRKDDFIEIVLRERYVEEKGWMAPSGEEHFDTPQTRERRVFVNIHEAYLP